MMCDGAQSLTDRGGAELRLASHVDLRVGSAIALHGRRVHAGRSSQWCTTLTLYFAAPPVHSHPCAPSLLRTSLWTLHAF